MFYYKVVVEGQIVNYQETDEPLNDDLLVEMTETEYNKEVSALLALAAEQDATAEQSKDEQIAALEQENAALLFQILTGEEYANV